MRNWKQEVAQRLARLPAPPARHAAIVEEVAAHLEDRHRSLTARGIADLEADRVVLQEFSDSDVLDRELRRIERRPDPEPPVLGAGRVRRRLDWLWQDVRYAARVLRRSPGFTAVAAVTLALGVGANAAIFAVVNTVMLRPLPYADAGRLVRFWESNPAKGWPTFSASHPTFLDWRAQNHSFERIAAHSGRGFALTGHGDAEIVRGSAVTSDFLPVLGAVPLLGRNFRPDEDRPGGNTGVVVLTHGLWQRRFGGNPAAVGTTVTLDGRPHEVIGVLPPSFVWGGARSELFAPLAPDPARPRADHRLAVIGRLKPGVSLEQAHTEMQAIAARIARDFPQSNEGWTVVLRSFYDWLVPLETRQSLLIMMGAVGMVLLIACGNVASLMLARASGRQRELSVRAALGADRSRIISQLLVESCALGLLAGCLGLLVASMTTRLVIAAAPTVLPRLDELSVDGTVIAFGFGISLVAAVLFGVAPAIEASRPRLHESLKEGSRHATGGRARHRLRSGLVVAEVALSVALLIGAGLLVRSFWRLQQVDPGFDVNHLVTMRVSLPRSTYDSQARNRAFHDRLLVSLAAVPGVTSVANSSGVPLAGGNTSTEVTIPGKTLPKGVQASADWRIVSPGYFRTLGIPLRGRDFDAADAREVEAGKGPARLVTIISEEMARRYWPGEDPIGKTVILHSFGSAPQTIVGVAGDVRSFGLDAEPAPMVYGSSLAYSGWNPMSVVVRSEVDPLSHVAAIRAAVRLIDVTVPVYDVAAVEELRSDSLGPRRFNMYLLVCFSGLALALACIGLFGVLAYLVAQRTRDIGIRMALGARRADVMRLIVGEGMALAVAGAVIGVAVGFGGARVMRTLLFAVEPFDAVTFATVPVVLVAVALLACYAPARRATRVDPLTALRSE